ncbi:LacI family transcriptional regulator [Segnochrobactraceae bacterium EtOH-i3]
MSGTGETRRQRPAPARPAEGAATLKTIATIAGLGLTTVSKALKDAPDISRGTKERVRRIAEEIGYRPNRAGIRLRTGKTNVISLILSPHEEILGFGSALIYGISEALAETSYHLVVAPHFLERDPMAPIRYIAETRSADGLIITRTEPDDPRIAYLIDHKVPFVTHGRSHSPRPHPYFDFDNEAFARHAVDRLVSGGRRRLVLLSPPEEFTFCEHMRTGFFAQAATHGVSARLMPDVTLDSPFPEIHAAAARLAAAPEADRPDGIVCPGDVSAAAVSSAFAAAGLKPGQDFRIIAKRTSAMMDHILPSIGAVHEDIRLAGQEMARLLIRAIDGEPAENLTRIDAGTDSWPTE